MTTDKQRQAQAEFVPQGGTLKGQRDRIIDYIVKFGSITPMGAIHAFGCTKLSTRIGEIEKRSGCAFVRTSDEVYSRTGRKTKVRRYSFAKGLTADDYRRAQA